MPDALPALSLIAMPGRRRQMIDLCRDAERRGFTGIYVPSPMGNMSMCEALAWQTETIPFAHLDRADLHAHHDRLRQSAAMMHEVSGGRFRLGIGIAHGPSLRAHGRDAGQAARRHPRVHREVPRRDQLRPAAADHRRGAAQEDGGAGGRARRGRGVRQRLPQPHGTSRWRRLPAAKRNEPASSSAT